MQTWFHNNAPDQAILTYCRLTYLIYLAKFEGNFCRIYFAWFEMVYIVLNRCMYNIDCIFIFSCIHMTSHVHFCSSYLIHIIGCLRRWHANAQCQLVDNFGECIWCCDVLWTTIRSSGLWSVHRFPFESNLTSSAEPKIIPPKSKLLGDLPCRHTEDSPFWHESCKQSAAKEFCCVDYAKPKKNWLLLSVARIMVACCTRSNEFINDHNRNEAYKKQQYNTYTNVGKPGAEVSKKKTISQRKNLPIECAQGDQPLRCPNRVFWVNEPSAVPWWWCGDLFWCGWLQDEMK